MTLLDLLILAVAELVLLAVKAIIWFAFAAILIAITIFVISLIVNKFI